MRTALAVLAFAALAFPAAAQEVGGNYTVQGTNFDGTKYGGTVTITVISDSNCIIEWVSGPNTSQGICMVNGPAFAAAYTQQGVTGLLIYQIMDDGVLNGIWTVAGANGYGTEMLIPE